MKYPIKPPFSYGFPMVFLWLPKAKRLQFDVENLAGFPCGKRSKVIATVGVVKRPR
jgi:hypothetical protein